MSCAAGLFGNPRESQPSLPAVVPKMLPLWDNQEFPIGWSHPSVEGAGMFRARAAGKARGGDHFLTWYHGGCLTQRGKRDRMPRELLQFCHLSQGKKVGE